ncbi:hypothetical protein [Amantichitinum ursilacus]|uniref:Fibronectin type-III domain-containing protein n=1 Tax=Amantichitinum ursilacus TaxID=857265 RepID=A0A0N0GL86_9NEIS|nr:hypothetical protein [Amantichitinum ursilacus]KPC49595.1 hypothetical protein WG78_19770 [Amantichitinum ursilacus]
MFFSAIPAAPSSRATARQLSPHGAATTRRAARALLAIATLAAMTSARAGNQDGDTVGCAAGQPCISNHYMRGTDLVIEWSADQSWSKYHIRWQRLGQPVHTADGSGGDGGRFTIHHANAGATYTFAVSGCVKHYVGKDRCSPWESQQFVAR